MNDLPEGWSVIPGSPADNHRKTLERLEELARLYLPEPDTDSSDVVYSVEKSSYVVRMPDEWLVDYGLVPPGYVPPPEVQPELIPWLQRVRTRFWSWRKHTRVRLGERIAGEKFRGPDDYCDCDED